ncbi:MAG: hypothetical protein CfClM3_1332 [Methanobrevibacter sp. CfCl-M3]
MFKKIFSIYLIVLILSSTLSTSFTVLDNNMLNLTIWNADSGNKHIRDNGYVGLKYKNQEYLCTINKDEWFSSNIELYKNKNTKNPLRGCCTIILIFFSNFDYSLL